MDNDVCGWIIEFLVRQKSLDDRILNDLIRVLPLPNTSPRLKKSLILRKIDSDIKKGTISERTIEFIEQIEKLDLIEGDAEVSEAMKAAYCTVAMHCTAKFVEESESAGDKKEKDISALRRIWSGRIREMERSDVAKRVGMTQDDFIRWVHDLEAGVLNVDISENILKMSKSLDVLQVLRRYINEAKEKMGPSFMELACETILNDDALSKTMGLDEVAELNYQSKDRAPTNDANANCNGDSNEPFRAPALPAHKHVAPRSHRGPGRGTHKGAKIVDPLEGSHKTYDHIPTPEVNKVREALKTSSFELHAVVKDPLPDALRLAESFKVSRSGENVVHEHVAGNSTRINDEAPSHSHDSNDKTQDVNGDDVTGRDKEIRIKPSLLERNKTAHTIEWSDSIDSCEEGSLTRPHLPNPPKRKISPSSLYDIQKLAKKRKKKRWTTLEEDTLRTGVQKYGRGNWKLILNLYRDIFEDRTEVDLKDKWRNLTRW